MPACFEADPDRIRHLGATFRSASEELALAAAGFEHDVTNVEEAFGLLGPSTELYHEYLALARDCASGLETLGRALVATGSALHTTAANYDAADANSVMPARLR